MNPLIHTKPDGSRVVRLNPGKRVLFLTKDYSVIEAQLSGVRNLRMAEVDQAERITDGVGAGGKGRGNSGAGALGADGDGRQARGHVRNHHRHGEGAHP